MIRRIEWFDTAKGIGIILVVFGHVFIGLISAKLISASTTTELIRSVIYSFHMPLFFVIAGVFMAKQLSYQPAKILLFNRISTIFYPYIIWSLLQGSIELLANSHKNNPIDAESILSLLWEPRSHFWFLYELFLFSILALLFQQRHWANFIILTIGLLLYCSGDWGNEWSTWRYFKHNLVYFFIGIVTGRYLFSWHCSRNTCWLLGICFMLFQYIFHFTLDSYYLDKSLLSFALAITSFLFIAGLSQQLNKNATAALLNTLGKHSLAIYLLHVIVLAFTRTVLTKIFGIHEPLTHLLLATILAVTIPLAISMLAERYHAEWLFRFPQKPKQTT